MSVKERVSFIPLLFLMWLRQSRCVLASDNAYRSIIRYALMKPLEFRFESAAEKIGEGTHDHRRGRVMEVVTDVNEFSAGERNAHGPRLLPGLGRAQETLFVKGVVE